MRKLIIALILCLVFASVSFAATIYSHTFEIIIDKVGGGTTNIQGEIAFNGGQQPALKTNAPLNDVALTGVDAFGNLIKAMVNMHNKVGEIQKIEFVIKP